MLHPQNENHGNNGAIVSMRVFFEVFGALGVALTFYLYGYEQGRTPASDPCAGIEMSTETGGEQRQETSGGGIQYFYLEKGKSILLTAKELVFAIRAGSCHARSDLICVVLDGKDHSMKLGTKVDFVAGNETCALELIEFPSNGAKSQFKLACQLQR